MIIIIIFCGMRASHCCALCRCCAPDAQVQQPRLTGPAVPRHVESSWTGARTRVPCISRRTLNHCTTREALRLVLCPNIWSVLENVPCILKKNVYSAIVGWSVL